jgi:hypothetical protein
MPRTGGRSRHAVHLVHRRLAHVRNRCGRLGLRLGSCVALETLRLGRRDLGGYRPFLAVPRPSPQADSTDASTAPLRPIARMSLFRATGSRGGLRYGTAGPREHPGVERPSAASPPWTGGDGGGWRPSARLRAGPHSSSSPDSACVCAFRWRSEEGKDTHMGSQERPRRSLLIRGVGGQEGADACPALTSAAGSGLSPGRSACVRRLGHVKVLRRDVVRGDRPPSRPIETVRASNVRAIDHPATARARDRDRQRNDNGDLGR